MTLPRAALTQVSRGLTSLESLRIKDLPGFTDAHLADLACVLARLPSLRELKLRALGLISDAGIAGLSSLTQIRRLKLYSLGACRPRSRPCPGNRLTTAAAVDQVPATRVASGRSARRTIRGA